MPTRSGKKFCLSYAGHEFFESPLAVIFMAQQHFFDRIGLEAHLIKLSQETQELSSLKKNLK